MARDADGNYYYDEGTLAEQFDNWEVYEDENGDLGFYNGNKELRVAEVSVLWGAQRGAPDTTELEDGEKMMYVADGSAANSAAGDLVVARNNSGTIEEAVVSLTFAAV